MHINSYFLHFLHCLLHNHINDTKTMADIKYKQLVPLILAARYPTKEQTRAHIQVHNNNYYYVQGVSYSNKILPKF